jgi:hypothetical protein
MWLYVSGILNPDVLSPDVDSSVLVGFGFAEQYLSFDGHPTTIYLKAAYGQVNTVYNLLGNQAYPENPSGVEVSQPSNALVAQADAKSAFNTLFLGLGLGAGHRHRPVLAQPRAVLALGGALCGSAGLRLEVLRGAGVLLVEDPEGEGVLPGQVGLHA